MPPYAVDVKPLDVQQSCWLASPSPERADIRSVTPQGFARAVFAELANHSGARSIA